MTYAKTELYTWLAELECYRIKKTTSSGEELSYINFDSYLCDQRAPPRDLQCPARCATNDKWYELRAKTTDVGMQNRRSVRGALLRGTPIEVVVEDGFD